MLDYSDFKEQFDEILRYSQYLDEVKTDEMLNTWAVNKEEYFRLFGNKLIWTSEEPIQFHLPAETREGKVIDFIYCLRDRGYKSLSDFIEINKDDFYNNVLTKNYTFKDQNLGENITIPSGIKLVKAFKFFFDKNLKEDLNYWQDYASRIIQEDKVEGYLCLSIHPIDFLTLSENTHKWRSCHALDGEYRAGNLSYLMDSSTVIAYLISDLENLYNLPNLPYNIKWNSKKWRRLFFFSKDKKMCMAGRPYPFDIDGSLEVIKDTELFKNIVSNSSFVWDKWRNSSISNISYGEDCQYCLSKTYYPLDGRLISGKALIKDAAYSTHYNDLLYSSFYKPYYIKQIKTMWGNPSPLCEATDYNDSRFEIGAAPYCIACGKYHIERGSDTMLCSNCHSEQDNEPYAYCEDCGISIRSSEDCYWIEGCALCPDCYRKAETIRCACCGEEIFAENAREISEDNGEIVYYCSYCYSRKKAAEKSKDLKYNFINGIDFSLAEDSGFAGFNSVDLNTMTAAAPTTSNITIEDIAELYYNS